MFAETDRTCPRSRFSRWLQRGYRTCCHGWIGAMVLLPASAAVAQQNRFLRPNAPTLTHQSSIGGGSKVVNIYPINGPLNRQDPVSSPAEDPWDSSEFPAARVEGNRPGADLQDPGQNPQLLPGLPEQFGLQIPAEELEAEILPDSREAAQNPPRFTGVSWVGLKDRAQPRPAPATPDARALGTERAAIRPMSYAVRRPSPPPPVINVFQPAIVQVPFHVQVVPMYVEAYPAWYGPAAPWPHYFGQPSVVPVDPAYRSGDYSGSTSGRPLSQRHPAGIDPRMHVPTDQPMFFLPDVHMVEQQSNSVDYVSFPHNFHSYPRQRGYGVNFQTFPVHRLLP